MTAAVFIAYGKLAVPRDPELWNELLATRGSSTRGQFQLIAKDDVKAALGRSPNKSDALAIAHHRGGMAFREDAATVLADLRTRLRFDSARRQALATERDRLLALARDFAARARTLHGDALRELLRPWLAGATLDKDRRLLTLSIRRVPEVIMLSTEADRC